jgi:aminoglycoside phosphotransferase (APT) family kinase protein
LVASDAIVLHASNKITLRLLPYDVVARVAPAADAPVAQMEVGLALRLVSEGAPVAAPDPRLAPGVYESENSAITFWTYYEPPASSVIAPADYAGALARLHAGLRTLELPAPHFTERVSEAEDIVGSRELSPALADSDRALLTNTLQNLRKAIVRRGAAEQLLHGEPHPGNLLPTKHGPLFIDLETVCRGPVEFDLAHVPEAVTERYPAMDHELLGQCRVLVLAMVAAWRWDQNDNLPNGRQAARKLLSALQAGPPYPELGATSDAVGS